MTDPAVILRQLAEPATNGELLRRFAETRDWAAFAELVRRHGPVVLAACRRGVRHHHDADDAFQAVFLVLARRAGAIERPGLLGNWLYRVAVGVARNARRAAARRREREVQSVDIPEPVARSSAGPDDLGPVLDEELGALPAWYRDAVALCDLRGLSRADAAAALGVPIGTLDSRLAAGRKKLAARLVRRGVTLSVAGLLAEARAVAVPDSLLTKTCGLVDGWAAGVVVPAAVLRLANGGLKMRSVLLGGVVALSLAAGVAVAAGVMNRPATPPTAPPGSGPPAAVAAVQPAPAPQPGPAADQPAKLGPPRLKWTADLRLQTVSAVAWSRDGTWLAAAGLAPGNVAPGAGSPDALAVLAPGDPGVNPGHVPLPLSAKLVGFTADGKTVLAVTRETGLISGEHRLHRLTVARPQPRDPKGDVPPVFLDVDRGDPGAVPAGAEGLTPTGPQDVRFLVRTAGRVTVWHADVKFDGRWPLGGFDWKYSALRLTPDGRRVVGLAGQGVVEGYDATTGKKLWATEPVGKLPEMKLVPPVLASQEVYPPAVGLAIGLSQDGRRAVLPRGPLVPVLSLDLDTGKALPVPADLGMVFHGPVAVSGDGRLAALAYTAVVPVDDRTRAEVGDRGFKGATHGYGATRLTVWETATGAVVQTWEGRASGLAFHPIRPVLAVLEPHAGGTRLGLWDFVAQP